MFRNIILVGLAHIVACAPGASSLPYSEELLSEEYDWSCHDYIDHTEIDIWYIACDDVGSLEAGYRLVTGDTGSRSMDLEDDCVYIASFILIDEVCMQVEEVSVIEGYSSDG
jgi:hypothetical protein